MGPWALSLQPMQRLQQTRWVPRRCHHLRAWLHRERLRLLARGGPSRGLPHPRAPRASRRKAAELSARSERYSQCCLTGLTVLAGASPPLCHRRAAIPRHSTAVRSPGPSEVLAAGSSWSSSCWRRPAVATLRLLAHASGRGLLRAAGTSMVGHRCITAPRAGSSRFAGCCSSMGATLARPCRTCQRH